MNEIISIQKKKEILEKQLNKIRAQEERELIEKEYPALKKKYVGKYFKYINSYGNDNKWPLYTKVLSASKKDVEVRNNIAMTYFKAFTFQTDCYDKIEIEPNHFITSSCFGIEITEKEFNTAWNKMIDVINKLK